LAQSGHFAVSAYPVKSARQNGVCVALGAGTTALSARKRAPVASRVPVCLNDLKSRDVGSRVRETEGLESGSAGGDAAGASGVDAVAAALALGGASREDANAFLKKQSILAEANAQFARAAALDLTPSEKAELARLNYV
jgi:hypothetical protein